MSSIAFPSATVALMFGEYGVVRLAHTFSYLSTSR